ncbi:chemotaxis protein CheB [Fulvimonas sp. R45]|uniref:chemotaxis protein CheB n=1 Tax=Fulvimonas sp. R45 TaxID=3045937 RepID=UPI00265FDBB7|nr:chemotaxis protein CheB [Fulvimonas sp. R45]MDO1529117.1 chemotaxis protein CheB [Fulvimonas sp. R45]
MNEPTRTAVALLFDDADLGGQLRAALGERGARIVHEGALDGFDPARLAEADADVVVVSLDDESGDDALDRLSAMFDGDRPRVVFNDAGASRGLDGWDRARWARHLAAKVLAQGDVDPPRPQDARAVEVETAAPASAPVEPVAVAASPVAAAFGDEPVMDESALPHDEVPPEQAAAESETLAAELEALLAADAPIEPEQEASGPGLKFVEDAALPPLFDGDFAASAIAEDAAGYTAADAAALDAGEAMPVAPVPAAGFRTDHLSLAEPDDGAAAPVAAPAHAAPTPPAAPSWALLDDDAPVAPSPSRPAPDDFGIQKMSAADFLAPEAGDGDASPIEPGLSLELVSLEEAIAPQDYVPHEMMLDDLGAALGRLVVLGATTEGTASVCAFLSALPAGLRATVLHTQHLAGKPADGLVEYFAEHCALPVRQARSGMRARVGEVLVVPTDQQVRLLRDGSVDLQPVGEHAAHAPSIDASFTMAANVFGRDALAIVFAGSSTDAVGGCQAIHDRGGRVWVENSPGEHYDDMVGGVMAERLSQFSGTPHELAARLAEEFQTEGRR